MPFEITEIIELPYCLETANLFFIVDCSDSMKGKIDYINDVMPDVLQSIKKSIKIDEYNIAVMSFNSNPLWLTEGLVDITNFNWKPLLANGPCQLGKAFEELDHKLSKTAFFKKFGGFELFHYYPIIVLISHGKSDDEYKKQLDKLKQNSIFDISIKIAISIGDGTFMEKLQEFGSRQTVLVPHNTAMLKKMIKYTIIPRFIHPEAFSESDDGCQFAPWLLLADNFFDGGYTNDKHWDDCIDEVIKNDKIDIYRKKIDGLISWQEKISYNPILEKWTISKVNYKGKSCIKCLPYKKIEHDPEDINILIEKIDKILEILYKKRKEFREKIKNQVNTKNIITELTALNKTITILNQQKKSLGENFFEDMNTYNSLRNEWKEIANKYEISPEYWNKNTIFEAKSKLEAEDYPHAIALLKDLAINRNAEAFYLLGQCFVFSLGVPHNESIAHNCYKLAKKLGWTKFYNTCKCLPIYFLIDTGDSMANKKNALNELMNDLLMQLRQIKMDSSFGFWANFRIQAIAFSDTVRCYYDFGIVDINDFYWKAPKIGGKADYTAMWNTLDEKLLSLQENNCNIREPLFILITDGIIPDNPEKNAPIWQNKLFSSSNVQLYRVSPKDLKSPENLTDIVRPHYMPSGFPEWNMSKVSDSIEDIDNEINKLINSIRC